MDTKREFTVFQLVCIGVVSGVAVTLVKLIQSGFLINASPVESWAAGLTYLTYICLGAIGAVFLVDHDSRGQKMLKNAFLMGLVAPSFFLAVINQPMNPRSNPQDALKGIPRISELLIGMAYAQEPYKGVAGKELTRVQFMVLEKSITEPTLAAAFWTALGGTATTSKYTYVIGTTNDEKKAVVTAENAGRILDSAGFKKLGVNIIQPKGQQNYYVTLGDFGTANKAADVRTMAIGAAVAAGITDSPSNSGVDVDDTKRAAALLVSGRVVESRVLFLTPGKE